jgi:RNA polymerase sigma factor (sigma-70 family)
MKDSYTQQQLPTNSNSNLKLNAYQSHLVATHISLVSSTAKALLCQQAGFHNLTESDLSGAGYEALVSAACHYDGNRNASFKTYANKCIWHAMVAEINRWHPSFVIMVQEVVNGRPKLVKTEVSLFTCLDDTNTFTHTPMCCNWEAEQAWQLETLNEAIATLKPEEQFLIRCYYGFDNKAMKLEEIAKHLNVSTTAVHKRLKNAIGKLRTFIEGASSPYRMCA